LLYSIMHQESSFKPRAMSYKGARGLMQLMPGTAARFGVGNIWDPKQNIEGGARYMRFLLDLFSGDVKLALAGYNASEGAVMKYGYQVPPYAETQEYVRRIGRRYGLIRTPEGAAAHATLRANRQRDSTRPRWPYPEPRRVRSLPHRHSWGSGRGARMLPTVLRHATSVGSPSAVKQVVSTPTRPPIPAIGQA